MKHEVRLQSGRMIAIREVRQSGTYEGLLNGLPTKEKNQGLRARLREEHTHQRYGVPPLVISAEERELKLPEGESYPFGTPAELPSVTCAIRFESLSPTTPDAGDASGLVVVWFQDNFQFPPSPEVIAQIKSIDWDAHAGNFEY